MHLHVTCFMFLLCPMFTSPHPLRRRVGKQTSAAPELQLLEDLLGSVMSHNCLDTCLFRHLWRVHSITTNQIQAFNWTSSPVLAHFWALFSACHSQGLAVAQHVKDRCAGRWRDRTWTDSREMCEKIDNTWVHRLKACVAAKGGFSWTSCRSKTQRHWLVIWLHDTLHKHRGHHKHRQHVVKPCCSVTHPCTKNFRPPDPQNGPRSPKNLEIEPLGSLFFAADGRKHSA